MRLSFIDPFWLGSVGFIFLLLPVLTLLSLTASRSLVKIGLPPMNTTTNEVATGCFPFTDDNDVNKIKSRAIVVPRGGCDFYNKTKHFADAGASMVIVKNEDDDLSIMRMGISPRWKGLEFRIPIVMVNGKNGR